LTKIIFKPLIEKKKKVKHCIIHARYGVNLTSDCETSDLVTVNINNRYVFLMETLRRTVRPQLDSKPEIYNTTGRFKQLNLLRCLQFR